MLLPELVFASLAQLLRRCPMLDRRQKERPRRPLQCVRVAQFLSPSTTKRRSATDGPGLSGCRFAHFATSSISASDRRKFLTLSALPVGGLPIRFRLTITLDCAILSSYDNRTREASGLPQTSKVKSNATR